MHVCCTASRITYDKDRLFHFRLPVHEEKDLIQYSKKENQCPIEDANEDQKTGEDQASEAEVLKDVQIDHLEQNFKTDIEEGGVNYSHEIKEPFWSWRRY